MRKICLLIAIFFLQVAMFPATAQKLSGKEKEFLKTCDAIAQAFLERDMNKMNSFIHPEKGIYLLYRFSMLFSYMHLNKLPKKYSDKKYADDAWVINSAPLDLSFPSKDSVYIIRPAVFDSTINFDCDNNWNKHGSFVDSVHKPSLFSDIIKQEIEVEGLSMEPSQLKIKKKELAMAKTLEKKSRMIVFNEFEDYDELVFYMTLINGKWYLSLIHCAISDCGAW